MIIKPARMNRNGINAVQRFTERLARLENALDQRYIPGISADFPGLKKPFNVPILGDNESIAIGIDWPRKKDAPYFKRVEFAGMMVAEEMTTGRPKNRDLGPVEEDTTVDNEAVSEAVFAYTGEWGGFLYAAISYVEIPVSPMKWRVGKTAIANFVCFENEAETDQIHELLRTGTASSLDIVNRVMQPELV